MVRAIKWFNSLKDKHPMKFVMFDIKDFCLSIRQDVLRKALNYADEDINTLISMIYKKQENHYCLTAPIAGFRSKEVCLI